MGTNQTPSNSFRVTIALVTLALSGCGEDSHNHSHDTSSGHHNQGLFGEPGSLSFVTTADTSFVFSEASAENITITISHCDGTEDSVASTGPIDMTSHNNSDIPPGGVCLFVVMLQELKLNGEWVSGGGFSFEAPSVTTELWASMPFYSDDAAFLFELGGDSWPTADEMLVQANTNEMLLVDSESYEILVETLAMNSLIYRDIDKDGVLSEADLEKSPLGMAATRNVDTGD